MTMHPKQQAATHLRLVADHCRAAEAIAIAGRVECMFKRPTIDVRCADLDHASSYAAIQVYAALSDVDVALRFGASPATSRGRLIPQHIDRLRREMDRRVPLVLIAQACDERGAVLGIAEGWRDEGLGIAEVAVIVRPTMRRFGVAGHLLRSLEQALAIAGCNTAVATIDPVANPAAAAMIIRGGYRHHHGNDFRKTLEAEWIDMG